MSVESYGALDESSLRSLLDGTVDLDERRLIRSAIRELRRKEIQHMEAVLASKRFRPTRAPPQENKENQQENHEQNHQEKHLQHTSDSSHTLDLLSHKLKGLRDIEELTRMLRSAGEYEERKMIRAAIRQVREEQQPVMVPSCRASKREDSPSEGRAQESARAQDDPLKRGPDAHKTGSSMVLVFDHTMKDEGPQPFLIQAPRETPDPCLDPPPSPRPRSDSVSSDHSSGSAHSCSTQDSVDSSCRARVGSGASDRSQGPVQRSRLDSGASERSASSDDRGPTLEPTPAMNGSGNSTDSEAETGDHPSGATIQRDQADRSLLARQKPKNETSSSLKGRSDFLNQKITLNNSFSNGKPKDAALEQFSRTNSVRDRMRKFTESTQNQSSSLRQTPSARSLPPHASAETSSAGPSQRTSPPSADTDGPLDERQEPSAVQSQRTVGEAAPPLSRAVHSEGLVGGTEAADEKDASAAEEQTLGSTDEEADMKTFLTIEIKDGRTGGTSTTSGSVAPGPQRNINMGAPLITAANALGQRTELTLGLRATPFKISGSTFSSAPTIKMETEPIVASEPVFSAPPALQVDCPAPDLPNGSSALLKPEGCPGKLTPEQLATIDDEELLDKMLDESKDFEERRLIRAAMRDLRKRKRDQREKERESRLQELRQQRDERAQKTSRATAGAGGPGTVTGGPGTVTGGPGGTGEVVIRKLEKSADGSTLSQVTKTDRFAHSDDGSRSTRSTLVETSYVQKTDRGTVQSKSYSFSSSSSTVSSNTSKKVGSVFDRTDDSSSRGGALAAVERRQAERRKELMRAQTMPKASSMQARKAMIERLDKDNSGGSGGPALVKINRVQRSTSFGVPNANSIKQMLLDWCRAKTRSYEHMDIQNFSSSWSNGMAFCALVHHFFPEAFDYSSLSPSERRHNFDLAFTTAERMVDCPQLLDVDDMVKMREPDWKCVYTYLQEFYRGLVTKGLVKTRGNS